MPKPLVASTALFIALVANLPGGAVAIAQDRAVAVQPYRIVGLRTLGGSAAVPSAVNVFGEAVGYSQTSSDARHATLWKPNGKIVDLTPTGSGVATSINSGGTIGGHVLAGGVSTDGVPFEHAVVWIRGRLVDLTPVESFGQANAINDEGTAAGFLRHSENDAQFAMIGRTGHPNLVFERSESFASAINDRGTSTGAYVPPGSSGGGQPFLWTGQRAHDLATLPDFSFSAGEAIDVENRVAGLGISSSRLRHVLLWRDDRVFDLGTPPGVTSAQPTAMNNADQMVGISWGSDYGVLPGGWIRNAGRYTSVDRLLPPGTSWANLTPLGINDLGQIVGYGRRGGTSRPYLLSPPPQTMVAHLVDVVDALDVRSSSFRRDADFLLRRVSAPIDRGHACAWLQGFSTYTTKTNALDRPERMVIAADVAGLEAQALKCVTVESRVAPALIVDAFARSGETRTFTVRIKKPTPLTISVAAPTNAAARLTIKGVPGRIAARGGTTTLVTTRRIFGTTRFSVRATRLARATPVVVEVHG